MAQRNSESGPEQLDSGQRNSSRADDTSPQRYSRRYTLCNSLSDLAPDLSVKPTSQGADQQSQESSPSCIKHKTKSPTIRTTFHVGTSSVVDDNSPSVAPHLANQNTAVTPDYDSLLRKIHERCEHFEKISGNLEQTVQQKNKELSEKASLLDTEKLNTQRLCKQLQEESTERAAMTKLIKELDSEGREITSLHRDVQQQLATLRQELDKNSQVIELKDGTIKSLKQKVKDIDDVRQRESEQLKGELGKLQGELNQLVVRTGQRQLELRETAAGQDEARKVATGVESGTRVLTENDLAPEEDNNALKCRLYQQEAQNAAQKELVMAQRQALLDSLKELHSQYRNESQQHQRQTQDLEEKPRLTQEMEQVVSGSSKLDRSLSLETGMRLVSGSYRQTERVRQQVEDKALSTDKLQQDNAAMPDEREDLISKNENLELSLDSLRTRLNAVENELHKEKLESSHLMSEVWERDERLEQMKKSFDSERSEYQERVNKMEVNLAEQRVTEDSLRVQICQLTADCKITELQAEIALLERKVSQYELQAQANQERMKVLKTDSDEALSMLRALLVKKEEAIKVIEEDCSQTKRELTIALDKLAKCEAVNAKLKNQLEQLEKSYYNMEEKYKRILDELGDQLVDNSKKESSTEKYLRRQRTTLKELRNVVKLAEEKETFLKKDIELAESEIEMHKAELDKYRGLTATRQQQAQSSAAIEANQTEVGSSDLGGVVAQLTNEAGDKGREIHDLQQTVKLRDETIAEVSKNLEGAIADRERLMTLVGTLKLKETDMESHLSNLMFEREAIERCCLATQERLAQAERQLRDRTHDLDKVETRLKEAGKSMDQLQLFHLELKDLRQENITLHQQLNREQANVLTADKQFRKKAAAYKSKVETLTRQLDNAQKVNKGLELHVENLKGSYACIFQQN